MCVPLRLELTPYDINEETDSERSSNTPKVTRHLDLSRSEPLCYVNSIQNSAVAGLQFTLRHLCFFPQHLVSFPDLVMFTACAALIGKLHLESQHVQKSKFLGILTF